MFLKSLTLKGFKSFAESTTLDLEPGITVVVGPNGSGKSNIVDAVAWVLGAQGPRTMRSGKMEDVIFAGTAKRAALGRAEVSLTIDNTAGLIPIELAEVTITRTLWRSGESEYALNGAACRLLDIQELLSDAGVGRQQHVIVGQGQLDAVLNAQPADRRLIIEEAAGVLKYRRRREKAQRRLESTEGNLLRVQDLLREVRRQLRPLERQADAARRHGDVVGELTALRLFLTGRELGALQARAVSVTRARDDHGRRQHELTARLSELDADVLGAEAALMAAENSGSGGRPMRDRLADDVGAAEGLRERARGLAALVAERHRSLERMRSASVDADLIASLEDEAVHLARELESASNARTELAPALDALAVDEAALAADRLVEPDPEATPAPDQPRAAGASEVRGELTALRSGAERASGERARLAQRRQALTDKAARLAATAAELAATLGGAEGEHERLSRLAEDAVAERHHAEAALVVAEERHTTASGQHESWAGRADALGLALDQVRARAGVARLGDAAGLLGTLLDVVDVEEGWEAAFEAAIGEAVAAVVLDGVDNARSALARLHAGGDGGAVIAAGGQSPMVGSVQGTTSVRDHVRSMIPAVDALLDRLLVNAVAVTGDWADALDVAVAHPDVVVVTRAGDRFAAGGWRAGAGAAGATGAALQEARSAVEGAAIELEAAAAALTLAKGRAVDARAAEAGATRAIDLFVARRDEAIVSQQRIERDSQDAEAELATAAQQMAELDVRLARDDERIAQLGATLPGLEAEEAADLERAAALRAARGRWEQREAGLRARRTEVEVAVAGLDERCAMLTRRLAEVEHKLADHRAERDMAATRRVEMESQFVAVERLGRYLADCGAGIDEALTRLREQRRAHAERTAALTTRLDDLRRQRATAERDLTATRELLQRAELDDAEVRVRLEAATETCRRELDCEPEAAMAALCPALPPGTTAEHRARELERDLRLMGPINPLALEEHAALQERHQFLEAQMEDVKASRREMSKVIRAIDAEIIDVFSAAYADVADNFTQLFATLFPGGTGQLKLTDPDNLLDTGIEVEARPSGKNVKRLSLLSGGERSLTAVAFLFAVFRSRPSPFYLMDEVEAALDDVNLHRFLDLIREFRNEAQLVIVSHQRRTMEAADCLYGVSMQPGGSSKVVSERVSADV